MSNILFYKVLLVCGHMLAALFMLMVGGLFRVRSAYYCKGSVKRGEGLISAVD